MELLIVTGMSGAGKSQAANCLEDLGYFCVDNIPPSIIPSFVELSKRGDNELDKLAIVTDIRGGELFDEIIDVIDGLKLGGIKIKILFLDARDDVLIARYKENRRIHPLTSEDISLDEAVKEERKKLSDIRFIADYIVDTSKFTIAEFKTRLREIFTDGNLDGFRIKCKSFGFKYGPDSEADIVIDVRCLPNPYYVEDLKKKTGLDAEVRDYVMSFEESRLFEEKIYGFLEYSLPLYAKEGKSQLVIAFGCTGGKHRSVTFAERIYKRILEKGYRASVNHRDIKR